MTEVITQALECGGTHRYHRWKNHSSYPLTAPGVRPSKIREKQYCVRCGITRQVEWTDNRRKVIATAQGKE